MKKKKPDKKPDKNTLSLRPYLPGKRHIGELKDMAQQIAASSAALEGRMAAETAEAMGHHLRNPGVYCGATGVCLFPPPENLPPQL